MTSPRIPDTTVARIRQKLLDGQYVCDIARSELVSEYSVRRIAKRYGIKYAVLKRGTRWGTLQQARVVTVEAEPNWSGRAASLRWGNNWGRGFW